MSLLQEAMELCTILDKTTASDGYGGVVTTWVDGAVFSAAVVYNDSIEAQVAMAQGVTGVYTVTTTKDVILRYHDVFRRVSDGKAFRVLTDGDDNKTPSSASLNMRNVKAEEWDPNG